MIDKTRLTIVLTIKDRVPFTYRWLRYMDDMRCPYRILIADGGGDEAISLHLADRSRYQNLDYEYIRYPYDKTIDAFYAKFENVISRVKSEYLLLADNDDFYLLDRVHEIVAFLDAHREYSAARGELVYLSVFDPSGSTAGPATGTGYLAYAKKASSIEEDSPFERVENMCRNMSAHDYYANWYCVVRARVLQAMWKFLITRPIREVIVAEIVTHVSMAFSGKIKILPFPFYVRQSNTSTFGDRLVIGNEFLERCIVQNSFSEFRVLIDLYFARLPGAERDRVLRAIAAWLEEFVSNMYVSRTRKKSGILLFVRTSVKRVLLSNRAIARNYHRLLYVCFPWRKSRPVRLKLLEPYILEGGHRGN